MVDSNNTIDFRLRLKDEISTQMKKTEKMFESSLKDMTEDQAKLNKEIFKTEKHIQTLKDDMRDASKERQKDIKDEISLQSKLLSEQRKQLRLTPNKKGGMRDAVGNGFKDAVGDVGRGGLSSMGALGGVASSLGPVGVSIGVAVAGMTAYHSIVKENDAITSKLNNTLGITGDQTFKYGARVKTLSEIFDEDYNEIINAANSLSKQMGISGEESIRLIDEGFKKGANSTGEFLDILKEYPVQFQEAGLSAEESIALISQTVKSGMYSDKGVDLIKEGSLRLKEYNKDVAKTIDSLPEHSAKQIKLNIAEGETFKAMQLISGELKNISDPGKRAALKTAIFGGVGEDAGEKMIEDLENINLNLEEVNSTMTDFQKSTENLHDAWNTLLFSITGADNPISTLFQDAKLAMADFLDEITLFMTGSWESRLKIIANSIVNKLLFPLRPIIKMFEKLFDTEIDLTPYDLTEDIKSVRDLKKADDIVKEKTRIGGIICPSGYSKNELGKCERIDKVNTKAPKSASKTISSDLKQFDANRNIKSLTINIENLVKDGINIETNNITESTAEIERLMIRALSNVVNQSANQIMV